MTGPDSRDDVIEPAEWDLVRAYLRAPGTTMAVMEVTSAADAASVLAQVRAFVGADRVHVWPSGDAPDVRAILDWIRERDQPGAVLVVGDLARHMRTREHSRQFWTWAEMQRERWPGAHAKVVFVLLPGQVDDFQRFAPMLWDWIPGHFDLREPTHEPLGMESVANAYGDADALRALVPVLREQLMHAREQKLADAVIRERYALPLFVALVELGDLAQARAVLSAELGPDFPARMSGRRAAVGWGDLGHFYMQAHDLGAAEAAYQTAAAAYRALGDEAGAVMAEGNLGQVLCLRGDLERAKELLARAFDLAEQVRDTGTAIGWLLALGQIALQQGEHSVAEDAFLQALDRAGESGDPSRVAGASYQLGGLARARGDHAAAEDWFGKALQIRQDMGEDSRLWSTYCALGQQALARGDVTAAEPLLHKARDIAESLGQPRGTGAAEHALGRAAAMQQHWHDAASHWLNALAFCRRVGAADDIQIITHDYRFLCANADADTRAHLVRLWRDAGLDPDDLA